MTSKCCVLREKAENKRDVELIVIFCFVLERDLNRNIKLVFCPLLHSLGNVLPMPASQSSSQHLLCPALTFVVGVFNCALLLALYLHIV